MLSHPIIRKAQILAHRRRTKTAAKLLRNLIIQEPDNEKAWLLLAGISNDTNEIQHCLKKVIELNPSNEKARSILAEVENGVIRKRCKYSPRKILAPIIIGFTIIFTIVFLLTVVIKKINPGNSVGLFDITETTMFSTDTPVFINTSTVTLLATQTITPAYTSTPVTPSKYLIKNITGQPMQISLDCESNSAVIFARFYGIEIDEVSFFINLPVSDNPNKGFVGDVHDEWGNIPPAGYGVYPAPIVAQLKKYGVEAKDVYNYSFNELKTQISSNNPVIVWVIGRVERGKASEYTSSDGETNLVARYQHTVLVIGYDETKITILDGERIYTRTYDEFQNSWNVLGNMAIIKSN